MRRLPAALFALALMASCVEAADTPSNSSSAEPIGVEDSPGWEQLDQPPLQDRIWNTATWTGTELIIWGGVIPETGTVFADGAGFDPTARVWRQIATAPIDGRVGHTAVWTGDGLIIWGGHHGGTGSRPEGRLNDGAIYDPATDQWSQIAEAPLTGGPGYAAAWTGAEMVLLGGNDGYKSSPENRLGEAASYDPATDRWRRMSLPRLMLEVDAIWTGAEVWVFGVDVYLGTLFGLAYNATTDSWRDLPDSPLSRPVPDVELTGGRVVAWSYDPSEDDGLAALQLDSESWQLLPKFPGQSSDGIPNAGGMGPDLILIQEEADIAMYSFVTSQWHEVPWPDARFGPFGVPPVWTGEEALFYEGTTSRFWSYRPDPELAS